MEADDEIVALRRGGKEERPILDIVEGALVVESEESLRVSGSCHGRDEHIGLHHVLSSCVVRVTVRLALNA